MPKSLPLFIDFLSFISFTLYKELRKIRV